MMIHMNSHAKILLIICLFAYSFAVKLEATEKTKLTSKLSWGNIGSNDKPTKLKITLVYTYDSSGCGYSYITKKQISGMVQKYLEGQNFEVETKFVGLSEKNPFEEFVLRRLYWFTINGKSIPARGEFNIFLEVNGKLFLIASSDSKISNRYHNSILAGDVEISPFIPDNDKTEEAKNKGFTQINNEINSVLTNLINGAQTNISSSS